MPPLAAVSSCLYRCRRTPLYLQPTSFRGLPVFGQMAAGFSLRDLTDTPKKNPSRPNSPSRFRKVIGFVGKVANRMPRNLNKNIKKTV